MEIADFIPPAAVASLSIPLSIARFENQRWIRARNNGFRGANEGFGFFVDLTGSISFLFGAAFIIAFAWQFGWQQTVALVLISAGTGMIWSLILAVLGIADHWIIWIIGTIAVWPLMIGLSRTISWFGSWG